MSWRRRRLPGRSFAAGGSAPFWVVAYTLAVLLATANLPTPLYRHYQHADHLSTATLTVVFAAYVLSVAATLAFAGQASDLIGHKAILVPAAAAGLLSMVCFAISGSLPWLFAGRITSGVASGALTAVAPAALADLEPTGDVGRASLVASAATVGGLAIGPMVSGLFVQFLPWPDRLVYVAFLPALGLALVGMSTLPSHTRSGYQHHSCRRGPRLAALRQLRWPSVPRPLRAQFATSALAFSTGWVGTAMFFALGPTFADRILHTTRPVAGAAVVFEVFVFSAAAQLLSRNLENQRSASWGLALFAAGMAALPLALLDHQPVLLLLAGAAAGAGQGLTHRASQATLLRATPTETRGQTAAAFYLTGYLAIAIILISLGILIDAAGPLAGLSGFSALTVTSAVAAIKLSQRH